MERGSLILGQQSRKKRLKNRKTVGGTKELQARHGNPATGFYLSSLNGDSPPRRQRKKGNKGNLEALKEKTPKDKEETSVTEKRTQRKTPSGNPGTQIER